MIPKKKPRVESVTYLQCQLIKPTTLECFGGPHDGAWRTVRPKECLGDLVAVWDATGTTCEVYQTVFRFTIRGGACGTVLRWVPSTTP